jgi:hypothetical protein
MTNNKFNPQHIISDLKRNKDVISHLLSNIAPNQYLYRENQNKWNLLEVICHLVDEEREDFVVRIKSVLKDPLQSLPSIDPVGWVKSRHYENQDYNRKLNEWIELRNDNCSYLEQLKNVSWENSFQHQHFGPLSAKLFLCNWLSHDYHHIRQIITIKRAYIIHSTGEPLDYAGNW